MNKQELDEMREWARRVTSGQDVSHVFLALWRDSLRDDPHREPIPIYQWGCAMALDTPIVIVAPHDARIPENMRKVAVAIERFTPGDEESLHAATLRVLSAAAVLLPKQ